MFLVSFARSDSTWFVDFVCGVVCVSGADWTILVARMLVTTFVLVQMRLWYAQDIW